MKRSNREAKGQVSAAECATHFFFTVSEYVVDEIENVYVLSNRYVIDIYCMRVNSNHESFHRSNVEALTIVELGTRARAYERV